MVGVLSSNPDKPVVVQHLRGGKKSVEITAGYFAKTLKNGDIITGEFDLAGFYQSVPLALGLGLELKDQAYVDRQPPEIQDILREIREETLAALEAQTKRTVIVTISTDDILRTNNQIGTPDPGGAGGGGTGQGGAATGGSETTGGWGIRDNRRSGSDPTERRREQGNTASRPR